MKKTTVTWSGSSGKTQRGYSIFLWLIQKGGRKPAYFLLLWVALYYRLFNKQSNKSLYYVYHNILKLPSTKIGPTLLKNYRFFGQSLIDKVAVALRPNHHGITINRDGEHFFHEMLSKGKGGILIGAHLGSWDLAGQLLVEVAVHVNIVMFDGEEPAIKKLIEQKTGKPIYNIIYIREDMSHIYKIHDALKNNELVCLHGDRFIKGQRCVKMDFLGQPAYFPEGPFALAAAMKAPISFVFAIKTSKSHYHFKASPPTILEEKGATAAKTLRQNYVALLEENLKNHPEQWYNYYDFWEA